MQDLLKLFDTILAFTENGNWKMIIMWIIGGVLIYLAIKKGITTKDEILSILFNYLLQENKQQEEIIKHILKLEVVRNDNSDTTS